MPVLGFLPAFHPFPEEQCQGQRGTSGGVRDGRSHLHLREKDRTDVFLGTPEPFYYHISILVQPGQVGAGG